MKLRPATRRDAGAISTLVTAVADREIASKLSPDSRELLLESMTPGKILGVLQATEPEVPALAGTAKQRRIYQYWLAEVAGEIVAVLGLKQRRHLYHLFVEPGFQRQGLGTRLWHQCCSDNSGELGVVTVHSSLGAVGFYQALGFRISGPPESLGGIPSVPLSWRPA